MIWWKYSVFLTFHSIDLAILNIFWNQLLKVLQWQFCNFTIISMFISWHSAVRKKCLFLLSFLFKIYMQTDFYIIEWIIHYCHLCFDVWIIQLDRCSYSKWLFVTFDITHFFLRTFLLSGMSIHILYLSCLSTGISYFPRV